MLSQHIVQTLALAMSLVSVPEACLSMIILMIFLILAGNTAFVRVSRLSVNLIRTHFPYFFCHLQPILYVTKVAYCYFFRKACVS